jgi:NADPH-dependent curcumin reductase CurA
MVGAVAQYNATEPPAVRNLYTAAIKEVTLRGMLGGTYLARFPEWTERAAGWLADGTLRTETTVVDGLERAPGALIGVLRGENSGKMLVRLAA